MIIDLIYLFDAPYNIINLLFFLSSTMDIVSVFPYGQFTLKMIPNCCFSF